MSFLLAIVYNVLHIELDLSLILTYIQTALAFLSIDTEVINMRNVTIFLVVNSVVGVQNWLRELICRTELCRFESWELHLYKRDHVLWSLLFLHKDISLLNIQFFNLNHPFYLMLKSNKNTMLSINISNFLNCIIF